MRLVLLGAGPGHLHFIRDKAKSAGLNTEIILISSKAQIFHKPAWVRTLKDPRCVYEALIDLRKISTLSGVTFIQSQVEQVDCEKKLIKFTDRASIQFDQLSIEGMESHAPLFPRASEYLFEAHEPVQFFQKLSDFEKILMENRHYPHHMVVVGGGATGVQLAMQLQKRFKNVSHKITWEILEAQDQILGDHHPKLRRFVEKELRQRDILYHTSFPIKNIQDHVLSSPMDPKKAFEGDLIFWAAGVPAPAWLKNSELPVDQAGHLDAHNNLTLKRLPFVVASGEICGVRTDTKTQGKHIATLEKILKGESLEEKKKQAKPVVKNKRISVFEYEEKHLQVRWGMIRQQEKSWQETQTQMIAEMDHLRGTKEQKLAQLTPQLEENIYVDKFRKRLLLDIEANRLEEIFSESLPGPQDIGFWCEKEYRDVFNDHYLSSYYSALDILDQSYASGGKPKYLRLYMSAPSTIKDVEILSQILIGAHRACKDQLALRLHLCSQAMNAVQFSLGVETGDRVKTIPEPLAYIALTRPLGLYGLLSQQGKEGWEGQWLSTIWDRLTVTEQSLSEFLQQMGQNMTVFPLSENGFVNDIVKHIGTEGWRVCVNLSQLPRWEGVDQILKRRPDDVLLQKNWQKGFRYWSGQGEQIPESQYLLWEPHLIRPTSCLLVDPSRSREIRDEFKRRYGQTLSFIGYVEKASQKEQTHYKLSDWVLEDPLQINEEDAEAFERVEMFSPDDEWNQEEVIL